METTVLKIQSKKSDVDTVACVENIRISVSVAVLISKQTKK
jgi:hypothetical protein